MLSRATAGLLCLTFCLVAAEKQRDWQAGKVLDTERQRYFAGTVGNSNTTGYSDSSGNIHANSSGGETAVYRVFETFVIEGDQYVYLAQTSAVALVESGKRDGERASEVCDREAEALRHG